MITQLQLQLKEKLPFSLLDSCFFDQLFEFSDIKKFKVGSTLLRPGDLNAHIFLILSGEARLLGISPDNQSCITLGKKGKGQLLGWNNLLRGLAFEHTIASSEVTALAIPSDKFIHCMKNNQEFLDYFSTLPFLQESFDVLSKYYSLQAKCPEDWKTKINNLSPRANVVAYDSNQPNDVSDGINSLPADSVLLLSSVNILI